MHAVVMNDFGAPDVLVAAEVPAPVERSGWVIVRLAASALNWHDVLVRRGTYGSPLPHVIGSDGAGHRVDTGESVMIVPSLFWGHRESAPSADWEILGDHRPGTYAEYVSVPEECVVPTPKGLDLSQAAAFSLVGLTTFRALFTRGRLSRGESLLVLGASGGIATTAVQLATAAGATVFVTSTSDEKIANAMTIGAAGGFDHAADDWVATAKAGSPGGEGFDLVLDSVGRWNESIGALRPGGRCVTMGASIATEAVVDIRRYYFGQYDLLGSTMGSPRDMAGLLDFVASHRVAPPIVDTTFALDDAAAAHRRLESGDGFGKIVLTHD